MKRQASTFSNLMEMVLTREDYLMARDELVLVYQMVTAPSPKKIEDALETIRHNLAVAITADWKMAKLEPAAYLAEAVAYLDQVPTVEMTLAFEPSQKMLARVVSKLREGAAVAPVVSLSINPSILGGMEVIVNGKFADLTLKKNIAEAFAELVPGVMEKTT
jgi:hypothetical protein